MRKTNNQIRIQLSVIAWCVLAVLLWALPCGATTVPVGGELNLNSVDPDGYIMVFGTLNLYPGAHVKYWISALGGKINIYGYGPEPSDYCDIWIFNGATGQPVPAVTVYGTGFALDDVLLDPSVTEFTRQIGDSVVLTGTYENGGHINLEFEFYGSVPVHLSSSSATEMAIDIKPGSDTNPINLKSNGVVPVAVLTTGDTYPIDPATVRFAGAAPVHYTLEDVDGDGDDDMLFHFRTQELNLNEESVEATLTAQLMIDSPTTSSMTNERASVSGTDKVQILPSKSKKK